MKKRVYGRKLSRETGSRMALRRSLARSLVFYGKIETTRAKAKFVRNDIEKLVTLAKKAGLSEVRAITSFFNNDREAVEKLKNAAKSFTDRTSGYLRLVNLPVRRGDNAPMARLEWVGKVLVSDKPKATSKKATEKSGNSGKTSEKSKLGKKSKKSSEGIEKEGKEEKKVKKGLLGRLGKKQKD